MYYIKKRDGIEQEFDKQKIVNAVLKAFKAVDGEVTDYAENKSNNIANYVEGYIGEEPLTIDEIQTLVEHGLMSCKRKDVATAYVEYRHDRDRVRNWQNEMMDIVGEKLAASNVQNQNANVDEYSFGGRKGEADSVIMKQYALDNCMSEKSRNRHLNNEIYIHDLDSYAIGMHNCLTIPFDDLLKKGFNTRQTDIRPANSINTAFQLLAVIFQLQSLQQFGGVSAGHLDWTMVPYIRKSFYKHYRDGVKFLNNRDLDYNFYDSLSIDENDYKVYSPEAYKYAMKMTERETKQAVEGMYHNLNTLQSRSGN